MIPILQIHGTENQAKEQALKPSLSSNTVTQAPLIIKKKNK